MVNVDIDEDLYKDIKDVVNKDRLNFPSIRHFVNKILIDKVVKEKNNHKEEKE